jgi:DnaK suppressor protein
MNTIASQARESLIQRRSALRRTYEDNAEERRHIGAEVEPDWPDRAAASEAAVLFDRLSADEQRELSDIEAALQRIEIGNYGACENCGGAIGRARLRALPEARLCITCLEKAERAA